MNENLITLCGDLVVQGAAAQRLAFPLLPYKGTLMPTEGMEKVWATPLPALELMTWNNLPLRRAALAGRTGHPSELLVAQRTSRVVLDDRDVDADVLGYLEDRGVDPLPLG